MEVSCSNVGVRSIELRAPRHDRDAQGRDCSCRLRDYAPSSEQRQEVVRVHYDNYHPLAGAKA